VKDKGTKLRQRAESALRDQSSPAGDLFSADVHHLIHELQVHQIELEMQKEVIASRTQKTCEIRLLKKGGDWFHAHLESIVIPQNAHGPLQLRTNVIDISARLQLEMETLTSKARLEYLLTSAPAVIYSAEPSGDYGATWEKDSSIYSVKNLPMRSLFDARLENCLPATSLKRANTGRLMVCWSSKMAAL